MLFNAYHPNIKKGLDKPLDMSVYKAIGNKTRINALFVALVVLMITYLCDQDGWLRWRPICLSIALWQVIWTGVQRIFFRKCDALMAKANNYNPADFRAGRTVEGTAFEVLTLLMLIGAWCAAAIKHQLTGRGFLDIPIVDLTACSVFAIGLLILAYFPEWMNSATSFKNDMQVLASIKRHRIAAAILAFFALIIPFIPDVTDKTLGYLYIVVFVILTFCLYRKTDEQEQTTTNE